MSGKDVATIAALLLRGLSAVKGGRPRLLLAIAIGIDLSSTFCVLFGRCPLPFGPERLLAGLSLRPLGTRPAELGFVAVTTRLNPSRLKALLLSFPPCKKQTDQDQHSNND